MPSAHTTLDNNFMPASPGNLETYCESRFGCRTHILTVAASFRVWPAMLGGSARIVKELSGLRHGAEFGFRPLLSDASSRNPAQFSRVRDLPDHWSVRVRDPSLRLKNGYGRDDDQVGTRMFGIQFAQRPLACKRNRNGVPLLLLRPLLSPRTKDLHRPQQ